MELLKSLGRREDESTQMFAISPKEIGEFAITPLNEEVRYCNNGLPVRLASPRTLSDVGFFFPLATASLGA